MTIPSGAARHFARRSRGTGAESPQPRRTALFQSRFALETDVTGFDAGPSTPPRKVPRGSARGSCGTRAVFQQPVKNGRCTRTSSPPCRLMIGQFFRHPPSSRSGGRTGRGTEGGVLCLPEWTARAPSGSGASSCAERLPHASVTWSNERRLALRRAAVRPRDAFSRSHRTAKPPAAEEGPHQILAGFAPARGPGTDGHDGLRRGLTDIRAHSSPRGQAVRREESFKRAPQRGRDLTEPGTRVGRLFPDHAQLSTPCDDGIR